MSGKIGAKWSAYLCSKVTSEGKIYRIYSNGNIEGFASDALVFNYFQTCAAALLAHRNDQQEAFKKIAGRG